MRCPVVSAQLPGREIQGSKVLPDSKTLCLFGLKKKNLSYWETNLESTKISWYIKINLNERGLPDIFIKGRLNDYEEEKYLFKIHCSIPFIHLHLWWYELPFINGNYMSGFMHSHIHFILSVKEGNFPRATQLVCGKASIPMWVYLTRNSHSLLITSTSIRNHISWAECQDLNP